MVSVCLPSDALLQHLPSYLGFSYLGRGVSLHGCSSKAQLLLLTLDEGYLLTAAPSDLERGIAPLGPPAPAQPPLLGGGVAPPGRGPWPWAWGRSSQRLVHLARLRGAAPRLRLGAAAERSCPSQCNKYYYCKVTSSKPITLFHCFLHSHPRYLQSYVCIHCFLSCFPTGLWTS